MICMKLRIALTGLKSLTCIKQAKILWSWISGVEFHYVDR